MAVPGRQGAILLAALEDRHALARVEVQRRVEGVLDVLQLRQLRQG